jgi:hypothetical protein
VLSTLYLYSFAEGVAEKFNLQLLDLPPSHTSPTPHPTSPTNPPLTHLLPHNPPTHTRPADYFTMLFVCWVIMMVMAYFFNLMLVGPVTFYAFVFLIPSFLTTSPHPHGLDSPHKLHLFGWSLPECTCPVTVVTCVCRVRAIMAWPHILGSGLVHVRLHCSESWLFEVYREIRWSTRHVDYVASSRP